MSTPYVVKLPNGDLHLGADVDGVFVPFATHSAGRVAQYVERGKNLRERADEGDELARDQIGKPLGDTSSTPKSVSKLTSDELDSLANELEVADYPSGGTVAEKREAIRAHQDELGEGA